MENKIRDINNSLVNVITKDEKTLNPCTINKAFKLVARGNAIWVNNDTIKILFNKKDTRRVRAKIIKSEDKICYICSQKIILENPTIDHVIPKSKYGSDNESNLRCCCRRCNDDKANRSLSEYIRHIEKNRKKYAYISNKKLKHLKCLSLIYNERSIIYANTNQTHQTNCISS